MTQSSVCCWTLYFAAASALQAQSPTRFEAASVKPAGPYVPGSIAPINGLIPFMSGGPGSGDPGQITWRRIELMSVVERAYKIPGDQISGPGWLKTEVYSIIAKLPPNTNEDRFDLMLQDLLAERFHLKPHHSTRDFPGYELVVAPGGPKLKPWHPDAAFLVVAPRDAGGPGPLDKDGFPVLRPGQRTMSPMVNGIVRSTCRESITALAQQLGIWISLSNGDGGPRPRVVDKTGLAGEYEFKLEFAQASLHPADAGAAQRPARRPQHLHRRPKATRLEVGKGEECD